MTTPPPLGPKAYFAEVAPESDPARALEREIALKSQSISRRLAKRRNDPRLGSQRPYAKTTLRRNMNELVGMVQAYRIIVGLALPLDTLCYFENARQATEAVE